MRSISRSLLDYGNMFASIGYTLENQNLWLSMMECEDNTTTNIAILPLDSNCSEHSVEIDSYYLYKTLQHIPSHKITYLEWGDPRNTNVVVCAHGLTRKAYDFDRIASQLSSDFRELSQ